MKTLGLELIKDELGIEQVQETIWKWTFYSVRRVNREGIIQM